MPRSLCLFAWVIVLIVGVQVVEASNASWPQWRGPGFQGSTGQGSYPESWAEEDGLTWKFELPGRGFSTPVVWNEHIIVTAPIGGKDGVLNLDFSVYTFPDQDKIMDADTLTFGDTVTSLITVSLVLVSPSQNSVTTFP